MNTPSGSPPPTPPRQLVQRDRSETPDAFPELTNYAIKHTTDPEIGQARDYFVGQQLGYRFERAVLAWIRFEETKATTPANLKNATKPKGMIPPRRAENDEIGRRPEQIPQWTKNGRKFSWNPNMPAAAQSRTEFLGWWLRIQPAFRQAQAPSQSHLPLLVYTPPSGEDWGMLQTSGRNGMFTVLLAMSWWGRIPGESDSAQWDIVARDLESVFDAMREQCSATTTDDESVPSGSSPTSQNPPQSRKRGREEEPAGNRPIPRQRKRVN